MICIFFLSFRLQLTADALHTFEFLEVLKSMYLILIYDPSRVWTNWNCHEMHSGIDDFNGNILWFEDESGRKAPGPSHKTMYPYVSVFGINGIAMRSTLAMNDFNDNTPRSNWATRVILCVVLIEPFRHTGFKWKVNLREINNTVQDTWCIVYLIAISHTHLCGWILAVLK